MTAEDSARQALEELRWGPGCINAACPHCSADKPWRLKWRPGSKLRKGVWKCRKCRKQFSVTVGTAWKSSHLNPVDLLAAIRSGGETKWESRVYRYRRADMLWPYQSSATDVDPLVLQINALVSRKLPEVVREDVCQELAVLILEGNNPSQELVQRCIKDAFRRYPVLNRHPSVLPIDAFLSGEQVGARFIDRFVSLEGQAGGAPGWRKRS